MKLINEIKNILKAFCTLGPIGYLPGSGTIASIFTLACIWIFKPAPENLLIIRYGTIFLGLLFIKIILKKKTDDPSEIVIDEVAGMLIAIMYFEYNFWATLFALLIFRILDISKPWIINKVEMIHGAIGIMADDILCGLITNLLTQILIYKKIL